MKNAFNWQDTYAAYVNMDHRTDRRERMELSLTASGIRAERIRGIPWQEIYRPSSKNKKHILCSMYTRTPGAIGCHYSQVSVMEKALSLGKSAWVMEDDLVFCSDLIERLDIIERFCNSHTWDIFWLGSTVQKEHSWHKGGHNIEMPQCKCNLGIDWEKTEEPRILRTYGCWSTYCYLVNNSSIKKVLGMLDSYLNESMGIDWLMMRVSPLLHTYCFLPGSVKQYDNKSDIGTFTKFSGFSKLGQHWYQDKMTSYDPKEFNV